MNILQVADLDAFSPFPISPFVTEGSIGCTRMEDWVRMRGLEWDAADVFVIDADFTFFGLESDPFGGIRLLKILRLEGYRQHCIIYSFLSFPQLLSLTRHNSILQSCGTTFVQLPDPVDEELVKSKCGQLCEEDMLPFFHAEAMEHLGMQRHSLANWWGLLRMYEVMAGSGLVVDDLPRKMADTLKRDSSYEGMLMNFARFKGKRPVFSVDPETAQTIKTRLKVLWRKELKVVYVDDCADDGWSFLLQTALYGSVRSDLFTVPEIPREGIDPEAMARDIASVNPDLVILDIRLTAKDETAKPSSLSGIALTRALVKASNTCPILIITASDKRSVSESAFDAGADAVWTKEGIEESRHLPTGQYAAFSTQRFMELIMQFRRLTGFEFTVLYDSLKRIREIKSSEDVFWWQKEEWYQGDSKKRTPLEKMRIVDELLKLFIAHKQFLSATQIAVKNSVYDMLTIKLCRILEILHPTGYGSNLEFLSLGKTMVEDWPRFSVAAAYTAYLVTTRNQVVHFDSNFDFARNDVLRYRNTLNAFFGYITLKDPSYRPSSVIGDLVKAGTGGKYNLQFRCASFYGRFNTITDIHSCERILGERMSFSGVQAQPTMPVIDFNLGEIRLMEQFDKDNAEYWTASFSLLQASGWKVILSLFNITARRGQNFRIRSLGDDVFVKAGDRLYFYVKWRDTADGKPTCSLFNVHSRLPEKLGHTYWTGLVTKVFRSDQGTYVLLNDIQPPFNARFTAVAEFLAETPDIQATSRICFRPDIVQEWVFTSPVRVSAE